MNVCRSCKAPIRWARTAAGRNIPLDAAPVAHGNVELDDQGIATVLAATAAWDGVTPRYTSHFATCPDADQHRRTP